MILVFVGSALPISKVIRQTWCETPKTLAEHDRHRFWRWQSLGEVILRFSARCEMRAAELAALHPGIEGSTLHWKLIDLHVVCKNILEENCCRHEWCNECRCQHDLPETHSTAMRCGGIVGASMLIFVLSVMRGRTVRVQLSIDLNCQIISNVMN